MRLIHPDSLIPNKLKIVKQKSNVSAIKFIERGKKIFKYPANESETAEAEDIPEIIIINPIIFEGNKNLGNAFFKYINSPPTSG